MKLTMDMPDAKTVPEGRGFPLIEAAGWLTRVQERQTFSELSRAMTSRRIRSRSFSVAGANGGARTSIV